MTKRISSTSIALLFAFTASIAAVASGPAQAASTTKLYACIAGDYKTLNLTNKRGRCPRGQKKISWNVVGVPGKRGAKGSPGSNGTNGANGSPGTQGTQGPQGPAGAGGGATGATGAVGAQGALGPTGATGATGPTGAPGSTGIAGQKGDQGDPGPTGATGVTGPAGLNGTSTGAYLSTSGGPITLQTDPGAGTVWIPLAGSASALDADWNDVMQYSPGDVTVKRVRATFRATQPFSNPFFQTLDVAVFSADAPLSSTRPLLTGASCWIDIPPLLSVGDVFSCDAVVSTTLLASGGTVLGASVISPFPGFGDLIGNISTAVDVG